MGFILVIVLAEKKFLILSLDSSICFEIHSFKIIIFQQITTKQCLKIIILMCIINNVKHTGHSTAAACITIQKTKG